MTSMQKLCVALDSPCDNSTSTNITGDFNLPHIDWTDLRCPGKDAANTKESVFLDFCSRNGHTQHMLHPTRATSGSVLDLVLNNDNSLESIATGNCPFASDREAITFSVTPAVGQSPTSTAYGSEQANFDHRKGDYEAIKVNLSLTNWNTFFLSCADIDDMYSRFTDYMYMLRDLNVPRFKQRCSSRLKISTRVSRLLEEIEKTVDNRELGNLRKELARTQQRLRTLQEHFFFHIGRSISRPPGNAPPGA